MKSRPLPSRALFIPAALALAASLHAQSNAAKPDLKSQLYEMMDNANRPINFFLKGHRSGW